MEPIIFASNNKHKLDELRAVAGNRLQIISLKEAGIDTDIPEPWPTFRQNALEKCTVINRITGRNCFSEDSGLEVDALNGEPGVYSARFAGEPTNHDNNIALLLERMNNETVRTARFRAVICCLLNGEPHFFEGVCEGSISRERLGTNGFGYDPVFIPEGYTQTFAQMDSALKNKLGHRKKAFDQFLPFLMEHF